MTAEWKSSQPWAPEGETRFKVSLSFQEFWHTRGSDPRVWEAQMRSKPEGMNPFHGLVSGSFHLDKVLRPLLLLAMFLEWPFYYLDLHKAPWWTWTLFLNSQIIHSKVSRNCQQINHWYRLRNLERGHFLIPLTWPHSSQILLRHFCQMLKCLVKQGWEIVTPT